MKQFRGIVESPYAPPTDVLWLDGNTLKYFSSGVWNNIIKEPIVTEEKNTSVTYDNNITLSYIILDTKNTKKTKKENLDKLSNNEAPYFVSINGGIGVYSWDSTVGGQAHVINAYGDTVYYTISSNGLVEKGFVSPDIYLDYVNAGGKKTKEEFIKELVDLIG